MIRSEELDLREALVYDPRVKRSDTNFFRGDTADVVWDSATSALKFGDTSLPVTATSYSQYLYGDFEFTIAVDTLSPDSNDSSKVWGLLNFGDTRERGAAYFEMRYDTVTGGDTANTKPLRAVIRDEAGNVQRKNITWDSNWNGVRNRYRISWEADGYSFLVNDTVYATLGDRPDSSRSTFQINTSIPQALHFRNRTVDTSIPEVAFIAIRNARKVI